MGLFRRLLDATDTKPKPVDPPDYPIYERGSRVLPEQRPHEHSWVERRVQAIEATCSDCKHIELRPNRRGRLKGTKMPHATVARHLRKVGASR